MSNTYGSFYGYTGLFPIRKDAKREVSHAIELRHVLSDLENGAGSLFSRTGLVHGARMFVLDDVVYNGHPTTEEHLQYEYLLLSLTFDGSLDVLAQRLAEHGGQDLEHVFNHCYGFSGVSSSGEAMLSFLKHGQVTTSFLYVEADGDLQETLRAFIAKKVIGEMLEQAQGASTEEKRALVREAAGKIASAALPLPGAFQQGEIA